MAKGESDLISTGTANPPAPEELGGSGADIGEVMGPEGSTGATEIHEDEKGFKDFDPADYHNLYGGKAYYEQQQLTDAEKTAMNFYSDPEVESSLAAPSADGLHSPSQDLNWAMTQGIPMSTEQQATHDTLMGAMHNTGYNINLTRYDHSTFLDTILKGIGVHGADSTKMSVSDLKKLLVGVKYGENKFVSGSYNNYSKALGSESKWDKAVFTQRFVKVSYQVDANVQSVMPGISPKIDPYSGKKNDLGEIIMAPSNGNKNFEIVDVKLTGSKAHPKGSTIGSNMTLNQIEVVVKVHKQ